MAETGPSSLLLLEHRMLIFVTAAQNWHDRHSVTDKLELIMEDLLSCPDVSGSTEGPERWQRPKFAQSVLQLYLCMICALGVSPSDETLAFHDRYKHIASKWMDAARTSGNEAAVDMHIKSMIQEMRRNPTSVLMVMASPFAAFISGGPLPFVINHLAPREFAFPLAEALQKVLNLLQQRALRQNMEIPTLEDSITTLRQALTAHAGLLRVTVDVSKPKRRIKFNDAERRAITYCELPLADTCSAALAILPDAEQVVAKKLCRILRELHDFAPALEVVMKGMRIESSSKAGSPSSSPRPARLPKSDVSRQIPSQLEPAPPHPAEAVKLQQLTPPHRAEAVKLQQLAPSHRSEAVKLQQPTETRIEFLPLSAEAFKLELPCAGGIDRLPIIGARRLQTLVSSLGDEGVSQRRVGYNKFSEETLLHTAELVIQALRREMDGRLVHEGVEDWTPKLAQSRPRLGGEAIFLIDLHLRMVIYGWLIWGRDSLIADRQREAFVQQIFSAADLHPKVVQVITRELRQCIASEHQIGALLAALYSDRKYNLNDGGFAVPIARAIVSLYGLPNSLRGHCSKLSSSLRRVPGESDGVWRKEIVDLVQQSLSTSFSAAEIVQMRIAIANRFEKPQRARTLSKETSSSTESIDKINSPTIPVKSNQAVSKKPVDPPSPVRDALKQSPVAPQPANLHRGSPGPSALQSVSVKLSADSANQSSPERKAKPKEVEGPENSGDKAKAHPKSSEVKPQTQDPSNLPSLPLSQQAVASKDASVSVERTLYATVFNSPWEILVSGAAQSSLRSLSRNESARGPVISKLSEVAAGQWRPATVAKQLTHTEVAVPVYESKVFNNLRVVWQVDVGYLESRQCVTQYIKLWFVGNHKDVVNILKLIVAAHKTYSIEHIRRARLRINTPDGLVVPTVFEDDGGDSKHITRLVDSRDSDAEALLAHDMAVTAKFIPLSRIFLQYLLSNSDNVDGSEFPFAVSQEEAKIIHHRGSVLLYGRSGTGKTSCSLFRLLAMFYVYNQRAVTPLYRQPSALAELKDSEQSTATSHFYQMFVTASPVFCARVRSYFGRLLESVTRGAAEPALADRAEAFLRSIERGALKYDEDTELRFEDLRVVTGATGEAPTGKDFDILEEELERRLMSAVPDSFAELKAHHFPLFLTYRKFSSMLRNGLGLSAGTTSILSAEEEDALALDGEFAIFLHRYWPHLNSKLTSKLDPTLVFNEIMGIIKGSERAALSKEGRLSRSEYLELSTRSHGTFIGDEARNRVYDLFLSYEEAKGKSSDAIDRVNEVNRIIFENGYQGIHIHDVYVDEVQDQTMAELMPLISICSAPASGLFFAGDTAQTIARGSAFRFQDLSAMTYRILEKRGGADFAEKHKPSQFQLTRNYRSHDGILRLAASVLDLVEQYFPNSMDQLSRDRGTVDGPLPVCFMGNDEDLYSLFGIQGGESGVGPGGGPAIEFGAEQVILVRTEKDKQMLRSKINDAALILTIEQSKGMEFEDVLLFSPFGSSPAQSAWRVFWKEVNSVTMSCPKFDERKHTILATELKILYVGITRARQRLWVIDGNAENRGPLFTLWSEKFLVEQVLSTSAKSFASFSKKSTPDDWLRKGMAFFSRRQYDSAIHCFKHENRLRPSEEALERIHLADGHDKRVKGLILLEQGKLEAGSKLLIEGAETFLLAKRPLLAAKSFERGRSFKRAAELYVSLSAHRDASRCYLACKMFHEAGRTLETAKEFAEALVLYKDNQLWDDACRLVQADQFTEKEASRVARLANRYFTKLASEANTARMQKEYKTKGLNAFLCIKSVEEKVDIMMSEGLYDVVAKILVEDGRFMEAADILIEHKGDYSGAAEILERGGSDELTLLSIEHRLVLLMDAVHQYKQYWRLGRNVDDTRRRELLEAVLGCSKKLKELPAEIEPTKSRVMRLKHRILALELSFRQAMKPAFEDAIQKALDECAINEDHGGAFLIALAALSISSLQPLGAAPSTRTELDNRYADLIAKMSCYTRWLTVIVRFVAKSMNELSFCMSTHPSSAAAAEFFEDVLEPIFGVTPEISQPSLRRCRGIRMTMQLSSYVRASTLSPLSHPSIPKDVGGRLIVPVQMAINGMRLILSAILYQVVTDVESFGNCRELTHSKPCLKNRFGGCNVYCHRYHVDPSSTAPLRIAFAMASALDESGKRVDRDLSYALNGPKRRWMEVCSSGLQLWSTTGFPVTLTACKTIRIHGNSPAAMDRLRNLVKYAWAKSEFFKHSNDEGKQLNVNHVLRAYFAVVDFEGSKSTWPEVLARMFHKPRVESEEPCALDAMTGRVVDALRGIHWGTSPKTFFEAGCRLVKEAEEGLRAAEKAEKIDVALESLLLLLERMCGMIVSQSWRTFLIPKSWMAWLLWRFPTLSGITDVSDRMMSGLRDTASQLLYVLHSKDNAARDHDRIRIAVIWLLLNQHKETVHALDSVASQLDALEESYAPRWLREQVGNKTFGLLAHVCKALDDTLLLVEIGPAGGTWVEKAVRHASRVTVPPRVPFSAIPALGGTSTLRADAPTFVPGASAASAPPAEAEDERMDKAGDATPADAEIVMEEERLTPDKAATVIVRWYKRRRLRLTGTRDAVFDSLFALSVSVSSKWPTSRYKCVYLSEAVEARADLQRGVEHAQSEMKLAKRHFTGDELLDIEDRINKGMSAAQRVNTELAPRHWSHAQGDVDRLRATIEAARAVTADLSEKISIPNQPAPSPVVTATAAASLDADEEDELREAALRKREVKVRRKRRDW